MSIRHILEEERWPYCGIGLIGKVVIYDFKSSRDYLSGIVIINEYICMRCLITTYQEVRDFEV